MKVVTLDPFLSRPNHSGATATSSSPRPAVASRSSAWAGLRCCHHSRDHDERGNGPRREDASTSASHRGLSSVRARGSVVTTIDGDDKDAPRYDASADGALVPTSVTCILFLDRNDSYTWRSTCFCSSVRLVV